MYKIKIWNINNNIITLEHKSLIMSKNTKILFRRESKEDILEFPPHFRDLYNVVKDRLYKSAYDTYFGERDDLDISKEMFVTGLKTMYKTYVKDSNYVLDLAPIELTRDEKEKEIDFGMEVIELSF